MDRFLLTLLILSNLQVIYVVSWDWVGGVAGQLSLGHTLPFGVGAYGAALASLVFRVPAWTAVLTGVLMGGVAGFLQGIACYRLRGASVAIATLALAEVAHELAGILEVHVGGTPLGGEGGVPVDPVGFSPLGRYELVTFIVTLACALGMLILFRKLRGSGLGLTMRAIHRDEVAATASGVDVGAAKVMAFATAGLGAGLAGGLQALFLRRAVPSMLSLEMSFLPLALSIVGGRGTMIGPGIVAYLLTALLGYLALAPWARLGFYGLLLVVGLRLRPQRFLRAEI